MEKSLMVVVEETKLKVYSALNQIVEESKLPPFLFEGILTEMLADVRNQKFINLMAEMNGKEEAE